VTQDNENLDLKGTGIGLALTKNLTELHHGTIHAKSETVKGSCFFIKILTISRKQENYSLQISQNNGFSCFPCEESWF